MKDLEEIMAEVFPIGSAIGIAFGVAFYAFTKDLVFITSIPCYTIIFSTTISAIKYFRKNVC